ncbi:DNA polymerase III subunit gamma/tau [Thiofilum flexile]|uniref:DNA polymerase III subunit gamma/tau n=1 Tax=Thiofilum flexile TaxID=125627 RepID=UPI00036B5846|nr:DNA polymerase III subunit gamma/tau [Thiofilum flexile]
MSYQVLARKWRPQNFEQMVGQQHVLRALKTALNEQRLHHAYLFTGTRGVGKTTVARVFAKSLNCEVGISATPCGVCRSCVEIAEGRHVDLIEVDAASRTKVEDTRELLENVQYAPTRGRFKIYLIDEVHMLSGHSFNALLKTLEEPPEHIKFLLATTDPQKLPVTVLSRCLQFNLKRMSPEMIGNYLKQVLESEQIPFEEGALTLLGRAADGSMRDALSLTDQAIVTGEGQLVEDAVRDMLGLLPQGLLAQLLLAIAQEDTLAAFASIEQLSQMNTDFMQAAENVISSLHQIAIRQAVPSPSQDELSTLVEVLSPADVQLYYQIALYGRRDLPLAPDARAGFEMMILRMLAFRLDQQESVHGDGKKKTLTPPLAPNNKTPATIEPAKAVPVPPAKREVLPWEDEPAAIIPTPSQAAPVQAIVPSPTTTAPTPRTVQPAPLLPVMPTPSIPAPAEVSSASATLNNTTSSSEENPWHAILPKLGLTGMTAEIGRNCILERYDALAGRVHLLLDPASDSLRSESTEAAFIEALSQYYQQPVSVVLQVKVLTAESPAQKIIRLRAARQKAAETSILSDPLVQALQQEYGGVIISGSIRPIEQ